MSSLFFDGEEYEILDAKESIAVPDCFVFGGNKVGNGHGEAKLYVGQTTDNFTLDFFGDFDDKFVVKKHDLLTYLDECIDEYLGPTQDYKNKSNMMNVYDENYDKVTNLKSEYIYFDVYRSNITPPRIYLNSHSEIYKLIRQICLPNISYISILRLRRGTKTIYYLRPFVNINQELTHKFSSNEIENDLSLSEREREALTKARIGQGKYRDSLLEECPYCPVTHVNDERLLIASHIKPWRLSNNFEKVDPKNGFMFTPTYDKLFDGGFISFEDDGTMLVSPWLSPLNQKRLNIYNGMKVDSLPTKGRENYLKFHRDNIFKK